jgi:SAM-dependent methyltransferase
MPMTREQSEANRALWDKMAEINFGSKMYDVEAFLGGKCSLTEIERELLGDIRGKSVLHLQCHFGQDTLSMARRGAIVTGVDFSTVAIGKARDLSRRTGLDATFVECDVIELDQKLAGKFDIVFASFGVLGWHEDLKRWAEIVAHFLSDDGKFCLAEFHPVFWMFNNDQTQIEYSYFKRGAIVEQEQGAYSDRSVKNLGISYGWNHSLGEVFTALKSSGLYIADFLEYDYSPHNIFADGIEEDGRFYAKPWRGLLPLVYALAAKKSRET